MGQTFSFTSSVIRVSGCCCVSYLRLLDLHTSMARNGFGSPCLFLGFDIFVFFVVDFNWSSEKTKTLERNF